jgi:hypothetical protein
VLQLANVAGPIVRGKPFDSVEVEPYVCAPQLEAGLSEKVLRQRRDSARLIRAFGTHGTRRTNVTWLGQPNAGERDVSLNAESLDDAAQNRLDGARLRDR